jgi:hypothetical protein
LSTGLQSALLSSQPVNQQQCRHRSKKANILLGKLASMLADDGEPAVKAALRLISS